MTILPAYPQQQLDLLTSLPAASPARTYQSPVKVSVLPDQGRDYGRTLPALLARYDRPTRLWRTSQRCFIEGWTTYSETWPRSGMTVNGIAYRLPVLVPLTAGTGCGLLPTPTASDADTSGKDTQRFQSLDVYIRQSKTAAQAGGQLNPPWVEWLMGYPEGWTDLED